MAGVTRVLDIMATTEVCEILRMKPQSVWAARRKGGHELFDKGFLIGGKLLFFREDVEDYICSQAGVRR